MENKLKVVEVFKGIQGEGRFAGTSMLFIRLSGCTRKCLFCDTKYHTIGRERTLNWVARKIIESKQKIVCSTGGEPLLYVKQILELKSIISKFDKFIVFHLETNGDLLEPWMVPMFSYMAVSPKCKRTAKRVYGILREFSPSFYDIKIVTDMNKVNMNLLGYASMLMPLTTHNSIRDWAIKRKVWEECIRSGQHYSPRLHYEVFGRKRGI